VTSASLHWESTHRAPDHASGTGGKQTGRALLPPLCPMKDPYPHKWVVSPRGSCRSVTKTPPSVLVPTLRRGLEVEKVLLGLGATPVASGPSVGPDDPVAREHEGQGVGGAGRPDGPHGPGVGHGGGDLGVAGRPSETDAREIGQDGPPEPARQGQVDGDVQVGTATGEILMELTGGASRTRGLRSSARCWSTVSNPSLSKATRTRPVGVAANSSVPIGESTVR
jgi:hypothetical protein